MIMLASSLLSMGGCSSGDDPVPVIPGGGGDGGEVVESAGSMVIYEANPRFFATNGCFDAITARLDKIQEMGATVIWIMPVCEPGVEKSVGSPYCIKNYKALNSKYGDETDFRELVDAAHAKGMRVIIDWVANHTSWDSEWITAHPDWYAQDGSGNIIAPPGQNWSDVAELNYDNAGMRAAMIDAMKYWITEFGIDGYRCDYTDGVPHDFWAEAITQLRVIDNDIIMLSESEGRAYLEDGFNMFYDWSYATLVKNLFNGKTSPDKFFDDSEELLKGVADDSSVMRYVYNHDVAMSNTLASLYGSADALPAAYMLTSMLAGTPLLYSSMETEISDNATLSFFDYRPLTWNDSMLGKYAQINEVFQATTNVRGGELKTYATGDDVVTFAKVADSHTMLVMVNISDKAASVKVPMAYSGSSMKNMMTGADENLPISIELDAYGYAVYYK